MAKKKKTKVRKNPKKAKRKVLKKVKKKTTKKKQSLKQTKKKIFKKKLVKKKAVKKKIIKKKIVKKKAKPKAEKILPLKAISKAVEEAVSELAGEDVVPLVRMLKNQKNVSEFKLADGIKREINLTRNMLYRLYNNNLVSFTRKKDKKKGWYIYYWTFNNKRIKDLIKILKKKKIEKQEERLDREKDNQFYICPSECMRLDFEQAHDFNFRCPECGNLLEIEDNTEKIKKLREEIERLKKELKKL